MGTLQGSIERMKPLSNHMLGKVGLEEWITAQSQKSSYSGSGDISEMIASLDETQVINASWESVHVGVASSSSLTSLGKRKASDLSVVSSDAATSSKLPRTTGWVPPDESDPFLCAPPQECPSVAGPTDQSPNPSPFNSPVIIAHSTRHQPCFEKRGLSYGVQYEIARLVSCGVLKYEDISLPDLDHLTGPNTFAPKTIKVLNLHREEGNEAHAAAFAKELAAKSPWEELDLEEKNLEIDAFAGLGFSTENPDWYGGKVHFRAKIMEQGRAGYRVLLERAELGPSCRFARRFGSTALLRIKIPMSAFNKQDNGLIEFFSRPFVLNGQVFRSFFAKDDNVFLFRTDETFLGSEICARPFCTRGLSILDFLNWHNPLELNRNQTMTKWGARFALGLSTSVPAVKVAKHDILHEDDIISSAGSDMTDGCGYINKFPLCLMQMKYEWESFPTAIQCRLAGSKGLLMRPHAGDDEHVVPIARLRPSQVKINYPQDVPPDPAMLVLDLLCASRLKTPGRLSHEVLINLAENGVPHEVFSRLFRDGLNELVDSLMTWDDPMALWTSVSQKGGVMAARRAREAAGESRARGYGEREVDEVELEDEDGFQQVENALRQKSSAWWWDELSGCPSSLEETVMVLLDAGFMPEQCAVLREKLKMIVLTSVESYARRAKIDVPMSCTAFIVPDPFGVLGPREVHIKSSRRRFKSENGPETDIILGDVLLTRNPCKLPTDVQKFTAVEKAELRHLTDVIVCSVQGDRRQADLLAGGDHDGDKALVIYQHEIVKSFVNADLRYSHEPEEVVGCFDSDKGKVGDFLDRMVGQPVDVLVPTLQKVLLGAIRDTSVVGKYSTYHENAIYRLGYNDPQTIRLAYMFCKVLDGAKTGLTVKPAVLQEDGSKWSKTLPPSWKGRTEDKRKNHDKRNHDKMDNKTNLRRPRMFRKFIMDLITEVASEEGLRQLNTVKERFRTFESVVHVDPDLLEPWNQAMHIAGRFVVEEGNNRMQRDLEAIAQHVRAVYARHRIQLKIPASPKKDKGAGFTELPIEMRQDKFRALSQDFQSRPVLGEVLMDEAELRRLRASYAYFYDSKEARKGWTRFPWDVAMRELCAIKTHAIGSSKTVTKGFYDRFVIK